MPTPPRASVIVASRGRPDRLAQCLAALRLQDHPAFEVIVVADPAGAAAAEAALPGAVKVVRFDAANISAARNLGLAQAAAPVVAFIDDDAVAEPTWLSRLTAPFHDGHVTAAGGFVRGWTGLHLAFSGRRIGPDAVEAPLEPPVRDTTVLPPPPGAAVVTIGTNCAFRADVLRGIGGFDEGYRYFLDESDVNLRLARSGALTAIVPGAEVLHLPGESQRRSAGRMPRSLFETGASTAVFLRRHLPAGDHAAALQRLRQRERRRLLHFMVAGRLAPGDVPRLLATLDAGIAEGAARDLPRLHTRDASGVPFLPLPGTGPRPHDVLGGWFWQRRALRRDAARLVAEGRLVSLLLFVPGWLPHRARFTPGGWWEQTGGLWGAVPGELDRPFGCFPGARKAVEAGRIAQNRSTMMQ